MKKKGSSEKRGPFMWYTTKADEKKADYKFPSKQHEAEYIDICESIWGGAPLDVNFATYSNLFKDEVKRRFTASARRD